MDQFGHIQRYMKENGDSLTKGLLALFGAGILGSGLYYNPTVQELCTKAKEHIVNGVNIAETMAKNQMITYINNQYKR